MHEHTEERYIVRTQKECVFTALPAILASLGMAKYERSSVDFRGISCNSTSSLSNSTPSLSYECLRHGRVIILRGTTSDIVHSLEERLIAFGKDVTVEKDYRVRASRHAMGNEREVHDS
jgi:hypothetical protein